MPDTEISKLVELPSVDLQATDPLAVADLSAVETKKVTVKSLIEKGVDILSSDAIDPDKIDWDSQADNQIKGSAIKDRSIAGGKLALDTVTASEIAPNAIGPSELANNSVDTPAIQDSAVTAQKIAADQIGDVHIVPGGLGTPSIADGAVTRVKMTLNPNDIDGSVIADNTLTSAELGPNSVGASELADDAVDTAALQNAAVTSAKIGANQVNDTHIVLGGLGTTSIADGAITRIKMTLNPDDIDGSVIADNSISANEIGPNAVGASELADNSVDTAALQALSVTEAKINTDAIRTRHIADNQITTPKLIDGAVTSQKTNFGANTIDAAFLLNESVTSTQIGPNAVGVSELADSAVDTAAIQTAAVTAPKIASNQIGDTHIVVGGLGTSSIADSAIITTKLSDDSVSTNKIIDANVTAAKLAPNLPGTILGNGEIDTDQIANLAVTTAKINDLAVSTEKLASNAVTDAKVLNVSGEKLLESTVTADKLSATAFSGGIELDGTVQHTNNISAGTSAGITWDANGHVTGFGQVPASDLPLATDTTVGAISVPSGSGLTVSGAGAIDHITLIDAGSISGITYDEHGHITAVRGLTDTDLPIATSTTLGAVIVPTENANPLSVNADGDLTHNVSGITAGTYASIDVDAYGHVVSADVVLQPGQVPNLDASKITTGQFPTARIADNAITDVKIGDYATCFMQEETPGDGGEFLGQFWFQPSTAQLRVYARGSNGSVWVPVGFGALQQQNLRFGFTYDASSSRIVSITQFGAAVGLAAGDIIPTASDALTGIYGVCVVSGNNIDILDLDGEIHTEGDWILDVSETVGWVHIDANTTGGGGGGAQVLNDLLDVTIDGGGGLPALADGQFLRYRADIGQWINVDFVGGATVSPIPPSGAGQGSLWWNSNNATGGGRLYIWYEDTGEEGNGKSSQWVPATPDAYSIPGGGGGGGGGGGVELLNDLKDVNAPSPADTAFLVWDDSSSRWVPATTIDCGTF